MKNTCPNCQTENELSSKYCSVCGYKLPVDANINNIAEEVQQERAKPKNKFNWKTILGFVLGFIVMFFISQSLFKPSIDKQLLESVEELNKNCPITVDQFTVLKNAAALPNKTIQYNYSLVGITKAEVNLDTVKKYVFPGVLANVKSNPQLKLFRENKVTFNYYYSDKNGIFVTKYVVKPDMYE